MNPVCPVGCRGCGACCIGLEVEIVEGLDDTPEEYLWIADEDTELARLVMQQREDGSCLALINGECSIYELRPKVCQDFEVGGDRCLLQIGKAEKRRAA